MAEYIVKSGDNLSTIAKNNNTTVQNLASLNKIADVNKIGVGQKLVLGTPNVPTSITSTNTAPATPTTVVQPQVATGATTLQSDIISKGQADTARAVAEEARIAQQQGSKAPTATTDLIKNILGVNTQTTPTTPSTATTVDNTMATTNVGGITQDKMATDRQFLADAMTNSQSKANLTAQEYAGTVDPAKQELNQINAQMNEEALAGRRRTEAVLQIPGITKEQAQDKINEISRGNASKLADLAVVQMAKQGAYDSAKEISDRAVEAKYEQEQNKLDALKFTYLENKDLFTKAEQRQFEIAQDDRKRKLDAEKENTQSIYDLSVEASKENAPASVLLKMRNAKTREEALAIGASYIGRTDRLYKQAQTDNIRSEIAKRNAENKPTMVDANGQIFVNKVEGQKLNKEIVTSDAYKAIVKGKDALNYLNEFEKTFKKTGSTSAVFDPIKNSKLKSQYNASTLNLKEFFNLGVLNGPDLSIIQGVLPSPTNTSNFRKVIQLGTYQPGTATQQGLDSMKKMVETTLDDRYNTISKQYESYSPNSISSLKEVTDSYVQQKAQLNPEIAKLVADNPTLSSQDIINIIKQ